MKLPVLLLCIFSFLAISAHGEHSISLISGDDTIESKVVIRALSAIINDHPDYVANNDVSDLHGVISVSVVTSRGATAIAAALELHPPNGKLGIAVRGFVTLVDADDIATGFAQNAIMLVRLFKGLLVEDKMVDKFTYMKAGGGGQIADGDLNEVQRLINAANSAAARGRF